MRNFFDLDPSLIYLNSGTHSIAPRSVLEAVTRNQRAYELNPTANLFAAFPRLWEVQKEIADFFHADPTDLILRSNVTEAMNFFILGVELPPAGEILVTNLEYGAVVNTCRFRAERDGLQMRICELPTQSQDWPALTSDAIVERICASFRPETSMLVASHVMTGNGLTLPLEAIARETRKRGILFAVDGAHGPGGTSLDFHGLQDLDFYGGNLHKWMMGPKGTCFGWISKRQHAHVHPLLAGWTTFETPEHFRPFGDGNRFTVQSIMPGCQDFAPFFALHEMLDFWKNQGAEKILGRIKKLQNHLEQNMDRTVGWKKLSPPAGPLRGPLLSYELPQNLKPEAGGLSTRLLKEFRLQVAVNPWSGDSWHMRLSPHIYNTEEEIDRAVAILARL